MGYIVVVIPLGMESQHIYIEGSRLLTFSVLRNLLKLHKGMIEHNICRLHKVSESSQEHYYEHITELLVGKLEIVLFHSFLIFHGFKPPSAGRVGRTLVRSLCPALQPQAWLHLGYGCFYLS